MTYSDLPLTEEIRRCLHSHCHPVHPRNIRLWVERDREERNLAAELPFKSKPIQSLDHIKRVMRYMDDVEAVAINGKWYRQIKQKGLKAKLTRAIKWLDHKRLKNYLIIFQHLGISTKQGSFKSLRTKLKTLITK